MSERPGSVCPADGRALDPVEWSVPADVAAVIDRCRAAQSSWSELSLKERIRRMKGLARRIVERRDEVGRLLTDEMGRGQVDNIFSEITFAVDYAAGAAKVARQALATRHVRLNFVNFPGKRLQIEAVPRGVIGVIEPWNYPLLQFYKPLWPALLAGNTVVIKPSEHTPRTGAWLAAQCAEVLGEDVVGLVQGAGEVGQALVDGVDAVVFCGSVATGKKVAVRCAERLIPCSIELGGKDAAIVLEDCRLERTVAGIVQWSMQNAGQDCSSIERIYVVEEIADAFVEKLTAAVASLSVHDGTDPLADIGPLQNPAQLEIVKAHVDQAVTAGATLKTGGRPTGTGYGFQPTVLDHCTADMDVIRHETFGPVAAVIRVEDEDAAVAAANECEYGLSASVWTRNLPRGEELARRIDAGVVYVNNHSFLGSIPQVPWTGTGNTGTGIAASEFSYDTFVRRQTLLVDSSTDPDVFWKPVNADLATLGEAASRLALGALGQVFTLLPLLGKRKAAIKQLGQGLWRRSTPGDSDD